MNKYAVDASTLVQLLQYRALHQRDTVAYTFLKDGETEEITLTYQELDQQARVIAALLQSKVLQGERAILLYPPGLKFIAAFFGCLYAGVVAVPAYPPRPNHSLSRLQAIVADAQATIALSTINILSNVERQFSQTPDLQALCWITTDNIITNNLAQAWQEPSVNSDTLAFLQYTSGSTGTPKGVMVSHGNILYNERMIQTAFGHTEKTIVVGWLPLFHDMGLIGNVLQPLYLGTPCVLMSPVDFLQKPLRWLQTISHYKATTSGGPNFAYDLCVSKIKPEQLVTLDLSCWEVAFSGAEPVRAETLERFAHSFAPCGFRSRAFYPCYGMAETTLIVSGGFKTAPPVLTTVQRNALFINKVVLANQDDDDAQTLVGCGQTLLDQQIVIAHPETLTCCSQDDVGEIWVSGSNVAQGYWQQAEETKTTFQAYLADTGEGPFLRTGDLGFLKDGELFVTGRLKDLIIIRGRNYYPQDIEMTLEKSHPAIRSGCSAAFSVDANGEELLVIACEIERQYLRKQGVDAAKLDVDATIKKICQAVAEEHDLQVYAIVLLKTGSIPKTSSGKIQRRACRADFLTNSLNVVQYWSKHPQSEKVEPQHLLTEVESPKQQLLASKQQQINSDSSNDRKQENYKNDFPTPQIIQAWLISKIAKKLKVNPHDLDVREPLAHYGLDSVAAVSLSGDLENWLGRRLSPTLVYDYPSIEALTKYLAEEPKTSALAFEVNTKQRYENEPIAIIGIGCRFPGFAQDPESFWQLLQNGVDAITKVPTSRWDINNFYDPNPGIPGKMNTQWGGFLEQVDQFDSHFFGISPREAVRIDPQQRLLLEVAWEALEDAGQVPAQLSNTKTGVFIGISSNDYSQLQFSNSNAFADAYVPAGSALSIAANRLSYFFNFRGSSIAVDTACSSSLVAVHLACQSLWRGESTLALAGGVNLILSPTITISFTKAGFMAPDGRCKAFDAKANGYVRGEGAGIVVLKPLSEALSDGDPVYAIIRGSAVNSDGRTNGLTAPNQSAQEEVLIEAYRQSRVLPQQVQYVEAHGTGTLLGDVIEFKALGNILAIDRPPGSYCVLGSVKSNIGHLEAAAGIASLIKVTLSLKHRLLPPSLHFREPNPHIPFDTFPLRIQQSLGSWPEESCSLLAGVSSFGFGGTNAHVVLEEASNNSNE
jgi:acyl-CoA synthetase (AMP-forming)/AMP-acid ligase II/3-oxoacyl-(acyl-carrier-protein) synthase/acyl carrier protein